MDYKDDNIKYNKLYVEEMNEWVNEMDIRMKDMQNAIDISELIIESNLKQMELMKQRTNLAIDEYNEWAKEEGEPLIDLR